MNCAGLGILGACCGRAGRHGALRPRSLRRSGYRAIHPEAGAARQRTSADPITYGISAGPGISFLEAGAWRGANRIAHAAGASAGVLGDGHLSECANVPENQPRTYQKPGSSPHILRQLLYVEADTNLDRRLMSAADELLAETPDGVEPRDAKLRQQGLHRPGPGDAVRPARWHGSTSICLESLQNTTRRLR